VFFERTVITVGAGPGTYVPSPAARPLDGSGGGRPTGSRRPGRVASDRSARVGLQVLDLLTPWAIGVATLWARLATAATGPTDWDSAQYSAAVTRFDVTHGRPQPPGYWLYVEAGRLVHGTGLATVSSLVLVAAVASAAAAGLTVVAGRDLGGRWVGTCAGIVVATSPFAWFYGSIVATYSFDLAIAPLLIILAWRARPHSWHGAGALVALAVAAGFRQSAGAMFLPLALLAVAGSVRRTREALAAVGLGLVALAAWLVPMALEQPGGITAWVRASKVESQGAVDATSVLHHASAGAVNLGTFAAYTTLALLPLMALALVAAWGLGIRALVRAVRRRGDEEVPGGNLAGAPHLPSGGPQRAGPRHRRGAPRWVRPWYQSRAVILLAATVPAVVVVALVEFAKGGYLLSYLPGAVIVLLLAPAALLRSRAGHRTAARAWGVFATGVVVAVAVFGGDRFLFAGGVLPVHTEPGTNGIWLTQARYQAPYADTRSAIRSADGIDRQLSGLRRLVRPGTDVLVIDTPDGGASFYRQAGTALPGRNIVLVAPGATEYTEHGASLGYDAHGAVPVVPGGSVYLIASPQLDGMGDETGAGRAQLVPGFRIAGLPVWRILPGASILGVPVVAADGNLPLRTGVTG
jgi:hypothetical protein